MAKLVLELNSEEAAELAEAASRDCQTPHDFIKAALIEYLAARPTAHKSVAASESAMPNPQANERSAQENKLALAEAKLQRADAKRRMPGFGSLKGKLQVNGVAVADGVEYQNRLRDTW